MGDLPELDGSAFRDLLNHLGNRKGGGEYGLKKDELSRKSIVDPKMHHLLMKFALVNVPIAFTTVKINGKPPKKCEQYYIVAFGSYTGGELVIANESHNIWHRPRIVREGAEATAWIGRRWTLTFYSIESTKRLDDYEAVVVDDEWVISQRRDGRPPIYLKPEKRVKVPMEVEEVEEAWDDRFNEVQNLMLNASKRSE